MYDYLKSGRNAIRLIYFLIIGLAITDALKLLFYVDSGFNQPSWERIILFIVFFSFVSRFFIGAYRVISQDIDIEFRQPKIVIDIIGFCLQALAFYIYALNFIDIRYAQWAILSICVLDSVWLILLAAQFQIMDRTFKQWIFHNLMMIAFLLLNLYYIQNIWVLFAVSILAFIVDFTLNYDFYFAIKNRPGLTIFIAGPYGDKNPKDKINENVDRAREIGKELALKGHYPFIPHTMLHGWETDSRFSIEHFKRIDFQWLEYCDALFFIASSPGANVEKEIATRKGLQVFTSLSEVPQVEIDFKPKRNK